MDSLSCVDSKYMKSSEQSILLEEATVQYLQFCWDYGKKTAEKIYFF